MEDQKKSAYNYKLELLKDELKTINNLLDKVDNICQTSKYWALFLFVGTVTVILGSDNEKIHKLILIAPLIPIVFWIIDATWRRHQNRAIFRSNKISEYLNSKDFDEDAEKGVISNFIIWDPVGIQYAQLPEYKKRSSFWRMFKFKTIARFYFGIILLGIAIVLISYIYLF